MCHGHLAVDVARGCASRGALRVDTTVVETNIHYPTDVTLLADGVRVLTRTLRRLGEQVRRRARSVGRRVFEIAQRSRTAGARVSRKVRAQSKARMKLLYQELMGITRAVLRQTDGVVVAARDGKPAAQLPAMIDLLRRVVAQTRARALRGDTRFPGKVVSLFEPHTEIIRKGKLALAVADGVGLGVLANDLLVLARAGPRTKRGHLAEHRRDG